MAADAPISKLGDDLLEEILVRSFPHPRSACRSKSVCKRWNSLISRSRFNSRFVAHHRSRNEGQPPLLLLSKDDALPLPSSLLSFLPVPDEFRSNFVIWDSFKDLLLCGFRYSAWDDNHERARSLLICNPFTEQWVALPLPPETSSCRTYATKEVKLIGREVGNANGLDLGDGQVFVYPDYRFRVLVRYGRDGCDWLPWISELQVFCFESRKWSTIMDGPLAPNAASLDDGKLYWVDCEVHSGILRFDPFHPNMHPTTVGSENYFVMWEPVSHYFWSSHGASYVVLHDQSGSLGPYPDVFMVRRWEEGRMTWNLCYEVSLEELKRNSGPEVEELEVVSVLAQHSERPEILFLECHRDPKFRKTEIYFDPTFDGVIETVVFSCNLTTGKLELVADQRPCTFLGRWMVLQPGTTCFSTPIPSYEKLLGMYDGSCNDLIHRRKST
ncbi:unnamed protein product [Linum tenue]|uniref:F-box domain-containing protein n=1 Tax=Linum tenue TaxID=586396 RepID=A0AAV0QNK6_9ROSI|nr:unnamed protein product [Linum tenue]